MRTKLLKAVLSSVGILLAVSACKEDKTPSLLCAELGESWGYIDLKGDTVIPFIYDEAYPFTEEGLALVWADGKYGYIDKKGNYRIEPQYEEALPFEEGVALVVKEFEAPSIIDVRGKTVASLDTIDVEKVWQFSEGLAMFETEQEDGRGYINTKGKVVIEPIYSEANSFSDGLAYVTDTLGRRAYIKKNGKVAFEVPANPEAYYSDFNDGLAKVYLENSSVYGYIDKSGKYKDLAQINLTISSVYGYIDKSGKYKVLAQYGGAGDFHEGFARVSDYNNGKWGYINRKGKYVITPQFNSAGDFSYGLAPVVFGDDEGFIDKKGKLKISLQFSDYTSYSGNIAAVRGEKWGVINNRGEYSVDSNFDAILLSNEKGGRVDSRKPYSWIVDGGWWNDNPNGTDSDLHVAFYRDNTYSSSTYDYELGPIKKKGTFEIIGDVLYMTGEDGHSITLQIDLENELLRYGRTWMYADNGTAYNKKRQSEFLYHGSAYHAEYYKADWGKSGIFAVCDIHGESGEIYISQYPIVDEDKPYASMETIRGRIPEKTIRLSIKNKNLIYDENGNLVAYGRSHWPDPGFDIIGLGEDNAWYVGSYSNQ